MHGLPSSTSIHLLGRRLPSLLLAILLMLPPAAWCGGGPETTLLVVNADSPLSLAVANEYIRLRELPERQVLWLREVPVGEVIGIDDFRRHVLSPIRDYLTHSGLDAEIDIIAYSAGFPYSVNFSQDLKRLGIERNKRVGLMGSLTGLTYFMHRVLAMDLGYLHPRANQYFRPPRLDLVGIDFAASRAFRSRHAWKHGSLDSSGSLLDRYYLSVMLGYTGARGNSLPEILDYLGRAAGADGTRPAGTVYLMENSNIRSQVRQPLFPSVTAALRGNGRTVEVIAQGQPGQDGRIPHDRTDIIGLVAGTRLFDWKASGSRMLPGAIAEAFTSYGGHFAHHSQTKLSEFLRHGAAGSSGTVQEPYSFVEKFPVPHLHRYYADGSSLAEAFYLSVSSPYQLIVVGDPLARPFARFAELELVAPDPARPWQGVVRIEPHVSMPPGEVLDRVELWIDGLHAGQAGPGQAIELDTRGLADGYHDLRLVAVASGPLETRSHRSWPIRVNRHERPVSLQVERQTAVHGEVLQFSGAAAGAVAVQLYQGRRLLAEAAVKGGRWQAPVATKLLGLGQVRLRAEVRFPDGVLVRSAPLVLHIRPPVTTPGLPALSAGEGLLAVGEMADGQQQKQVLEGLTGSSGPREWRHFSGVKASYLGLFETKASGLYELSLEAAGRVTLTIDGTVHIDRLLSAEAGGARIALELGRGWHPFELTVVDEVRPRFPQATLAGPEPPFLLEGERLRHATHPLR
jgi:hypothetical protein